MKIKKKLSQYFRTTNKKEINSSPNKLWDHLAHELELLLLLLYIFNTLSWCTVCYYTNVYTIWYDHVRFIRYAVTYILPIFTDISGIHKWSSIRFSFLYESERSSFIKHLKWKENAVKALERRNQNYLTNQ